MFREEQMIVVTNRKLCERPLPEQVERLCGKGFRRFILREKDLSEAEYECLAIEVMRVCERYEGAECILHTFIGTAKKLGARSVHLPLPVAQACPGELLRSFAEVGISVHSQEQALAAEAVGATYLTAGHIFLTDCKKGVEPRGIEWMRNLCKQVSLPVYGIGGIDESNLAQVMEAGAVGVCMMSGMMRL